MSDTAVSSKPDGYVFGRPTSYRPEMCEKVMEWGAQGKSRTWMAARLGVDRKTIDNWADAHPDFLLALTRAKALEQMWWEDKGQEALEKREFQSSVWSRSMAARFPDEWREKIGHVGGNKEDEPIKQETTLLGADAFTRAIAGLAARSGEERTSGEAEPGDQG